MLVVLVGAEAGAHQVDEYLQAARVSVGRAALTVEVDLTPGTQVASDIVRMIDADADNVISPVEAETYGRDVLSDLTLELDDRAVDMTLTRIAVPSVEEMRHGIGTIRLRASADVAAGAGRHRIYLFNNHAPEASAYIVNALLPDEYGVLVIAQSRDARQRAFRLDFTVSPRWPVELLWLGVGASGLAAIAAARRSRARTIENVRAECRMHISSQAIERGEMHDEDVLDGYGDSRVGPSANGAGGGADDAGGQRTAAEGSHGGQ